MAEAGAPAESFHPVSSEAELNRGTLLPPTVLRPPANIASRWDGALRARLNRVPLENFLRIHSVICEDRVQNPLIERLELACLLIVDPTLPHRADWRALCRLEYFGAIGQVIARISRSLGEAVQEPTLWRVAALRTMGRLLSPILGIDMAASVAAASIATFGFSREDSSGLEQTLEALTVDALMSGTDSSLAAVRNRVREHLTSAAQQGAGTLAILPLMVTLSAQPPSNS